MILRRGSS